jgi:tetratricopeptide (TPR) repeat protein
MPSSSTFARVALVAVLAHAGIASAQAPAQTAEQKQADDAFKQGRELVKSGNYIDACEQFQKSQALDPALGTLFNIAQCSEKIGKLATAAAAYRELVAKDQNPERKETATKALAALGPRIPKIVAKVDKPPPGITISLDSKAGSQPIEPNKPVDADFGEYTLVARAKGYTEMISRFRIGDEGSTKTVDVQLVAGASNSDMLKKPGEADETPQSKRKLIGISLTAAGGATLATGLVFGVLARSAWADAKKICGGSTSTCATADDRDLADAQADKARSKATLSTVLVIGGAALAAAGVVVWVTAPHGVQVTPTASDSGAGVSFSGTF